MNFETYLIEFLITLFVHPLPMLVLYAIKGPFPAKKALIISIIDSVSVFILNFIVCFAIAIQSGYVVSVSITAIFFWGFISYYILKYDPKRNEKLKSLYETLNKAEDPETIRLTILRIIKIEKRIGKKNASKIINKLYEAEWVKYLWLIPAFLIIAAAIIIVVIL